MFKNAGKPNILDIYVTSATQNISNAEISFAKDELKSLSNDCRNIRKQSPEKSKDKLISFETTLAIKKFTSKYSKNSFSCKVLGK